MIKKITSIICALCLVLSLFSMLGTVYAATSDDDSAYEYWTNDFETENGLSGGTWYTDDTVDDFVADNVHRGNGSAQYTFKQNDWYVIESGITLKAGKTYDVTFWYKTSEDTGNNPLFYGLEDVVADATKAQWATPQTEWYKVSGTYTPENDDIFVIKVLPNSIGTMPEDSFVYIDDITVSAVGSLADFETEAGLSGGTWYTENSVEGFDKSNVHRGNGSLRYKYMQSDWSIYESNITLKAGKKYKVSFWSKTSESSGCPFYYKLNSLTTEASKTYGSASTSWKRYTATYTPTVDDKFVISVYSKAAGGPAVGSYVYFDDIVIAEASLNSDFELETSMPFVTENNHSSGTWYTPDTVADYSSDNVHTGKGSVRLAFQQASWLYYFTSNYALKEGKTYKLSFWYKTSASSGNAFYFNYWCGPDSNKNEYRFATTQWSKVEKTFTMHDTSGQNRDNCFFIKIYSSNDGGCAAGSYIYFDDIEISEVYPVSVTQAANGTATVDKSGAGAGDTVTFTANANSGHLFEKWIDESGNKVADQRIYSVSNITKALKLTPVFIADTGCDGTIDFETPNKMASGPEATLAGKWYTETMEGYDPANVHGGTKSLLATYTNSIYSYDMPVNYTLEAGKTYKVSLWYKGSLQLGFVFNDDELAEQQIYQQTGDTWQQKSFNYVATSDTTLKLRKYCLEEAFYGKAFYLDDIEIKELSTFDVTAYPDIADYITFPSSSLESEEITVIAKQYIDGNKVFYGWKKGTEIVSKSLLRDLVINENTELGEENIGIPVYVDLGDANGDGNVDILDLICIKKAIANQQTDNSCDLNFDGDVDAEDLVLIKECVLGIRTLSVPEVPNDFFQ